MSDEPLIFEHTSDEPEQNGFPLDTADLPLDSVDSSDSEEDVNQLLDLISKDYTNEDEDDEEEEGGKSKIKFAPLAVFCTFFIAEAGSVFVQRR